ncbi:TRAP-type C4-dicarboxylate transport system, large permease component [uncultured Desulfatiglans sp.]|uniref:TRAP-type C4-dicarboxylate transport system, large permease component n=1 Tax=Uncultured Desulfatiglans sp. TaxID=1748965 RepID=A0A653AH77_UNCDX|nr:TRAP-type C4-dicarboxylate transport system, large permease component [uncultured Desulfatiglans sp.]
MSDFTLVGIIGIVLLLVLFFTRMAVAYVMAIVGFLGYSYLTNLRAGMKLLAVDVFSVFSSYGLTLIPLFVFMGYIAYYAGVSRHLYDVAYKFIGRVRGGLAMATVMACAAFGAVCGSATATSATMGTIGLPEMKRYDYGGQLATGSVASGGGLGSLIPPSVVLIIYGILTEQSIGSLFIAGIVPGLFITFLFMVAIWIYCLWKPEQGPKGEKFSLKEMLYSLRHLWETIAVFAFVMGGLVMGLFTPTKSGAVGAMLILIIVVAQRKLSWENFLNAVYGTLKISCMVIMLIAGATVFGHFLALTRIPMDLATSVGMIHWPPWAIMALICLIFLIGGFFIDSMALIMLTIPIFYPIVVNLGYDPIWFGIVIVLVTHMGTITPPVGICVYIVRGIAGDVPLMTIFRGSVPFLLALIVGTAAIIAFPSIATFLPELIE